MIKKYIQFINENKITEAISLEDLPELNSFDELDKISNKVNTTSSSRSLTDKEKKLLDEYCKIFESKFLLTHEQIREVLLDLDLIDNLSIDIQDILFKINDGKSVLTTDFNYRNEADNLSRLISMKRWYNNFSKLFTYETIRPSHLIIIEKTPKSPFDNEKVYEYLEMVKDTFEDMCECNVILDKGGAYSMQFRIEYPETKIE
jgi:hypothetical protein